MNLKAAIRNEVYKAVDKARKEFPNHTFYYPALKFTKRGRAAGSCFLEVRENGVFCELNFNIPMAEENGSDFLERTPIHEVAHYVNGVVFDEFRGHGKSWKLVMTILGAKDTSRCHNYKVVERRKIRRVLYHCSCSEFNLTIIRHNKIKKGHRYFCRKCKKELFEGPLS